MTDHIDYFLDWSSQETERTQETEREEFISYLVQEDEEFFMYFEGDCYCENRRHESRYTE